MNVPIGIIFFTYTYFPWGFAKMVRMPQTQLIVNLSSKIWPAFFNQGQRVIEVPLQVQERASGTSMNNTFTAFTTMVLKPRRIILPTSVFRIALGTLWGIPVVLMGIR